jgi:hypothetical protein
MNGRNTSSEKAILANETKLESIPLRLVLINPKENAQASETSSNHPISNLDSRN